jgi:hypothetical protein
MEVKKCVPEYGRVITRSWKGWEGVWIEGLWITVTKVILMKPKYKFEEKIF